LLALYQQSVALAGFYNFLKVLCVKRNKLPDRTSELAQGRRKPKLHRGIGKPRLVILGYAQK
jgi:hypothetical protein